MERYNRGAGAVSAPTPPSAPANAYFTEGNPSLGVPATQPGPWWFHMITEEIRKVITDGGLTPDHTDLTQLSAAIQALIIDALAPDASETVKGIIEIATSAENAAGSDTVRATTPAGIRAALNATGSAPIYAARAWVRFNGAGVISIEGSGNVSSITDNATGSFTVNFTTSLPDANYAYALSAKAVNSFGLNDVVIVQHTSVAPTASACALMCKGTSGGGAHDTVISATFFR